MDSTGIVYVATKDPLEIEAVKASMGAHRRSGYEAPVTLLTSMPDLADDIELGFDLVLPVPTATGLASSAAEAALDRWRALDRSPYEKTILLLPGLVLDAAGASEIGALLESHEVVVGTRSGSGNGGQPAAQPLVGFRRSDRADGLIEAMKERLADPDGATSGEAEALASLLSTPAGGADGFVHRLADAWAERHLLSVSEAPAPGHIAYNEELSFLFPQQLYVRQHRGIAEFNKQLALCCADLCTETPPGAGGGLRSTGNLFEQDEAVLGGVRQLIERSLEPFGERMIQQLLPPQLRKPAWSLKGWATILSPGDHVPPHVHADGLVTGTYYVQCGMGDPADDGYQGRLMILNPIAEAAFAPAPETLIGHHKIDGRDGLLVLFPAYLKHHVNPVRGASDRIAISFVAAAR